MTRLIAVLAAGTMALAPAMAIGAPTSTPPTSGSISPPVTPSQPNQDCESLVRDIHDGTLTCQVPADVRQTLARSINKRRPQRARQCR